MAATHLALMVVFAAVVAVVMGLVDHERHEPRARLVHGLKVFGAFVGIGIAIGWVLYFIPL